MFVAGGGEARASASALAGSSTFTLKGISQEDARFTAFVQDGAAGRMVEVHIGDTVGKGQISEVSLHGLTYQVAGRVARVQVGQALDGNPWTSVADSAAPASISESKRPGGSSSNARASTLDVGQ